MLSYFMSKKKGFWEKLAYKELAKNEVSDQDELYLLDTEEVKRLKRIKRNTLWKAGMAGAIGVIVLYIPYYIWPEWFPVRQVSLPFLDNPIELEVDFLIYSFVLVFIEIWYLTYINIQSIRDIARACGFPNVNDENYQNNLDALIAVGLDKKQKQMESIGLNPYEGLSAFRVFIYQTFIRLKATLSGIFFKFLVKRMLGRYAIRAVVDMAGIPVYAFWNAHAANTVINEARVRVLAPPLIRKFSDLLYEKYKDNEEFKGIIYETLQDVSVSKRSFHYNHYLLAVTVLEKFDIPIDDSPEYDEDFVLRMKDKSKDVQLGFAKLFVFGIVIDGNLSRREKDTVKYLIREGVLPYSLSQIQQWSKDYFEGKGLEEFLN